MRRKTITNPEMIRGLIRLAEEAAERSQTRGKSKPGDVKAADMWEKAEDMLLDLAVEIEELVSQSEEEEQEPGAREPGT